MSDKNPEPLSALDKSSFAYKTIKDRMPTTLTQIIDGLHRREKGNWEDVKSMINKLSQLRYEVMTDKRLAPLDPAVASEDIYFWDKAFQLYEAQRGKAPTWFTAPWLFWECYAYRCIQLFADTSGLKGFDVFESSKRNSFEKSIETIEAISNYFSANLSEKELSDPDVKRKLFEDFVQVSLWGNECDLSMSNMSEKAMEQNPLVQLAERKEKIVVNHGERLWEHCSRLAQKINAGEFAVIIIVLDNAGPELFGDLCLADFLLTAGLASRIELHGKAHPWFVSDVTERDLMWTLERMVANGDRSPAMQNLGQRWQRRLKDGSMRYATHRYWTSPFDFAAMPTMCPELFNLLTQADLLIFKGDLNYRKLVGDLAWPATATFERALRGFCPAPLVSLRVCKADVTVGLSLEQANRLAREQADWMVLGKFAVIQTAL